MAVSPTQLALESLRQTASSPPDDRYLGLYFHFFELRVPSDIVEGEVFEYLFPLIINPQSYTLSEPFTVTPTPTQGGGLFVEENGIIQRNIRLSGTLGFKPRRRIGNAGALYVLKPEQKSFTRALDPFGLQAISGLRHLQYLQDSVFRTYADLKKDPTTAGKTSLIYHNPKDDEHWLVVPQKFDINRDKAQPTLYNYEIELLVVDKAEANDADFSEDGGIIGDIKDAVNTVKRGLALVEGAFNDLTAIAGEITGFVEDITGLIDDVAGIIDSVGRFVDGVVDLIESPLSALDSINNAVESLNNLANTLEEAGEDIRNIPDKARNKWRQIVDGCETIGQHPAKFETPLQKRLRENKDRQDLNRSTSAARRNAAALSSPPQSLDAIEASGTEITPGDVRSAAGTITSGRNVRSFPSAREIDITETDTLVSLAAKYLGDAREWQAIAVLNGLKPPFLDAQASQPLVGDEPVFPFALGVGGKILVPSTRTPPENRPQLPVLGVRREEPAANHLLGTDFKLEAVAGRPGALLFDIPIDTNRGSVDVQTVSGVANISQAIQTRLRTERGHDVMYRNLGLRRVVGMNSVLVDLEMARFRVQECLEQDSRIAAARKIEFINAGETDQLNIDIDLELRGFSSTANIKAVV